ncbi:hypothetical protein M3G91_06565 [Micromonospora chalcea]|uniref:hypothetical protein n=1 Tax=Micromonospora chalcea TaxID=1874 RepID=UPI0021A7FBF4|nr:hypothetical protein [Micromonospora chalcea]MCT2277281.1 hypothetical protein [Micromonospora chalcea]
MSASATEPPELAGHFKEIADRATNRSMQVVVKRRYDSGAVDALEIQLPSTEGTREFRVDADDAEAFASCRFEDWIALSPYHAIYDTSQGFILSPVREYGYSTRLWGTPGVEKVVGFDGKECQRIDIATPSRNLPGLELSKRQLHVEAAALGAHSAAGVYLKISGVQGLNGSEALQLLTRVTASLFFEIDVTHGSHFRLPRLDDYETVSDADAALLPEGRAPQFPRLSYDENAMTLYQYARNLNASSLQKMPLVEYLGFYQVIEYFMPAYSNADSLRRLRNALKDPNLDPDNDVAVGRLMSLLIDANQKRAEREQLKLTIAACIEEQSLAAYLNRSKENIKFFGDKTKILDVKTLNPANRSQPLTAQVADRIYDLRCRIVHSKEGGDGKPLLPFGAETKQLGRDIALVRFVARKVLIASGKMWR